MFFLFQLVLCLICCKVFAAENNGNAPFNCSSLCEGTYSPHTYEKNGAHEICKRGCRLLSVAELTSGAADSSEVVKHCKADCDKAYPAAKDSASLCATGCEFQAKVSRQRPLMVQPVETVLPAGFVSDMYSQMMLHMMQRMEFMMNLMNSVQQEEPQTGIRVIRIYSFSDSSLPEKTEDIASDEEPVGLELQSSLKKSERSLSWWHRFGLLALLLSISLLTVILLYLQLNKNSYRKRARAAPSVDSLKDDACMLLVSKTQMQKLPLNNEGSLVVHGEAGPLPVKAKI